MLTEKMKSIIITITVGLMLVAVAAADSIDMAQMFEEEKQDVIRIERAFMEDIKRRTETFVPFKLRFWERDLEYMDSHIERGFSDEVWARPDGGYSPEQIKELESLHRESHIRMRNALAAKIEELKADIAKSDS